MENLEKYTPTELLKLSNDIKIEHEKLKKEIIDISYDISNLENKINDKIKQLTEVEKKYVLIVEEIDNRE